jgi:hypothetical protein
MNDPAAEPAPKADAATLLAGLLDELKEEFPRFRLVPKSESRLSTLIDVALKVITFGGQNRYLTEYHTVIGDTLYLPSSWERSGAAARYILLRHERVHLRQKRRLGMVLMAFVYLVPFFPLGLAYGRARLEWEAYVETLRSTAQLHGVAAAADPQLRAHILERFTGPDYGWMWPFRGQVEGWYETALREIQGHSRPQNQAGGHLGPSPSRAPRTGPSSDA